MRSPEKVKMDEGGAAPGLSAASPLAWTSNSTAANTTSSMDHHSRPPAIVDNRPTTPKGGPLPRGGVLLSY
jgi:hypothetical protein